MSKFKSVRAYIAVGWDGRPRPWTLSYQRADSIQKATETMMGGIEYEELRTRGRRWAHCYRNGARIVRVRITPEEAERDAGSA